jgi:hypothetical protein
MKQKEKRWIAIAYFFGGKDDEEWLVLENDCNETEHRVIRGENLRDKEDMRR